ncbi:MAG: ParB/RepB/Spo0J family partition protein [Azonexus sp.]
MDYIETPLALIHPSPTNPRKSFPAEDMAEMIDSVRRHGVLQPVLARPWPSGYLHSRATAPVYELIAGERRYRAAGGAELETIPVMVRDLSDHEVLEIQIIENLQRKGLHPLEEAESYELMIKDHGYTADQLAEKIGKSRAYIYGRMKLTALCIRARLAFRDGRLTASTALLIARIPGDDLQADALDKITATFRGILSYRDAAEAIQRDYCFYLDKAPFPQENLMLAISAGTCSACPKRSGTNPELFPDIKRADVCTDPECYKTKSKTWVTYQSQMAKSEGKKVIVGKEAEKIDISYSSDEYLKLDDINYRNVIPGKGYITYRETLEVIGQHAPETVMIENQRKGTLVEAVDTGQLKKALLAAGFEAPKTANESTKENEKKAKAENEFRKQLFQLTHDTINQQLASDEQPDLETEELALVARQFWNCLWTEAQGMAAFHWTHEGDEKEHHSRRSAMLKRVAERIPTMSRREICLFLLDCSLIGQTKVDSYQIEKGTACCPDLIERARASGINPDALRVTLEFEKAQKKAKSLPAKTTSTPSEAPRGEDLAAQEEKTLAPPVTFAFCTGSADPLENVAPGTRFSVADTTPAASKIERPEVRYSHPKNAKLCWTGRGRKPKWVENWLAIQGNTLDQLLITNQKKKPSSAPHGANAKPCLAEPAPRCAKTLELPLDQKES